MARIRKNPEYKGVKVKLTGSFVIDQHRFSFTGCSGREACERLCAYIGNVQQHAVELPVSALSGNFRRATILLTEDRDDGAVISVCINGYTDDYTQLIPVLHQLCEIYDFPELAEILNAAQPAPVSADRPASVKYPKGTTLETFNLATLKRRAAVSAKEGFGDVIGHEECHRLLTVALAYIEQEAAAHDEKLRAQVTAIKADL